MSSVQDADKLDAIGAFGVLRCAAYSGATGVELYASATAAANATVASTGRKAKSSAIDHFHEKLFKLEGMMKVRFVSAVPSSMVTVDDRD